MQVIAMLKAAHQTWRIQRQLFESGIEMSQIFNGVIKVQSQTPKSGPQDAAK